MGGPTPREVVIRTARPAAGTASRLVDAGTSCTGPSHFFDGGPARGLRRLLWFICNHRSCREEAVPKAPEGRTSAAGGPSLRMTEWVFQAPCAPKETGTRRDAAVGKTKKQPDAISPPEKVDRAQRVAAAEFVSLRTALVVRLCRSVLHRVEQKRHTEVREIHSNQALRKTFQTRIIFRMAAFSLVILIVSFLVHYLMYSFIVSSVSAG